MVNPCPYCGAAVMPNRAPNGTMVCPMCHNQGVVAPPMYGTAPRESAPGAVGAMVCGILGLVIPYVGFILAIIAIALGAGALKKVKAQPHLEGRGMAVAGLVMGIVGVGIWVIVLVVVMLAVGAASSLAAMA